MVSRSPWLRSRSWSSSDNDLLSATKERIPKWLKCRTSRTGELTSSTRWRATAIGAVQSPPTYGTCEAALLWRVRRGNYGDVSLDGATWTAALAWPGPLHKGGGKGIVFIDEAMPQIQQAPIELIATGQSGGGMRWFMGTVTAGIEVRQAHIRVEWSGLEVSRSDHVDDPRARCL